MQRQVWGQFLQNDTEDEVFTIRIRVFGIDHNSVSLRGWVIGQKFWGVIYCYTIYLTFNWSKEVVIQIWYLNLLMNHYMLVTTSNGIRVCHTGREGMEGL